MEKLTELRLDVDHIDNKLLTLLAKRVKLIQKIGKIKKNGNISVKDGKREEEILKRMIIEGKKLGLSTYFIRRVWTVLFNESYKIEKGKDSPPLW